MATNTKPFSNLFSNTYYGDILAELIKLYNEHNHSVSFLKSFLVYNLEKGLEVTFSSLDNLGNADPFAQIGSLVPLTITRVTSTALTLSRVADASIVGKLTYVEDGEYKVITGIRCIQGSALIEWVDSPEDAGTVNPSILLKVLQKSINSYFPISNSSSQPTPTPPQNALVNDVTVTLDGNGFYIFSGDITSSTPNASITLNRGEVYNFTLSQPILDNGGLHVVKELVNPAFPLVKYLDGVSELKNNLDVVIGVKFYVPLVAPSVLYYQSATNSSRYGELLIVGGELTTDNAIYALWQQSTEASIPIQTPDYLVPLVIKTPNPYRLIEWNLIPHWTSSINTGYIFAQLQVYTSNSDVIPLSEVALIDDVGTQTIEIIQDELIPANSSIMCALYTPYLINGVSQEIYISDVAA
jgi:hypothetical protein